VYAGKDRHNAEVAAFHLSILLGLRRSPLTVGRKVNLRREVMPVATSDLLETFYQEGAVQLLVDCLVSVFVGTGYS
jgi:hypothetical protein